MEDRYKLLLGILMFVSLLLLIFKVIPDIQDSYNEKQGERNIEWDTKYKPICDNLGGLYLEEGYVHGNYCYLNHSGILHRGCMKEVKEIWYLVECGS